ncbi:MAG: MFS transporter [Pseudonocardiaceae bacterium]|nr:MFS transporter [Pseudonocardiaceae bacterium]
MTSLPSESNTRNHREARKVARASFIGTTIEWYDFFLYGAAAALVFGPQFFPGGDPVLGQMGAFATFAVGFLTRPIGGMIAGHFGDRIGRKRMLVLSLLVMGSATVLVGVLPNYEQIGVTAPIILVLLRLLQGLAVGAEWGGAALMAVEHAPRRRRTLYGSSPQLGVPAGAILSNVMMLGLSAATGDGFTEWGWRIGFIASVVLVVYGLIIRRTLTESPLFQQAAQHGPTRAPLLQVLRRYPIGVLVAVFATAASPAFGYTVLTFSLSHGTNEVGYGRDALLTVIIVVSVIQLGATLMMAEFSDRFGRRRTMIVGSIFQIGAALAFFPLFDTGVIFLAGLACTLGILTNAAQYAPLPAVMSDLFPTHLRYSGSSLGYQFGSIVGGSFAPIIATAIFAASGNSLLIGVYLATLTVIALGAIVLAHRPVMSRRATEGELESVQT